MKSNYNLLPYFIIDIGMMVREKSTSFSEDRVERGIVSKETTARRITRWKLPRKVTWDLTHNWKTRCKSHTQKVADP